jgi:hypothetical protein
MKIKEDIMGFENRLKMELDLQNLLRLPKPKSIAPFTIIKRPTEMLTNLDLKLKMVGNGTI